MINIKAASGLIYLFLIVFFSVGVGFAHEWMAPKEAADIKSPVSMNDQSIKKGKEIYIQNCATCHGGDIEGRTATEAGLEMSPPDLKKRISTHSDGDFFWKIQNGRGEMPAFSEGLTENETWDVINYIRHEAE